MRAVAAQQSLRYVEQVKAAADASAELARRMQAVGNFSKLQRAREQAFSAEAVVQLARAQQRTQNAREVLVRALGLDEARAVALKLPDRLPDLPAAPSDEKAVARNALDQRLDVQMARANLDYLARTQGLTRVTSFVNAFHVAGVYNSETGKPPKKGYELELALPIFDFGDAVRTGAQARYMAALNRTAKLAVDASSQVRENVYRLPHRVRPRAPLSRRDRAAAQADRRRKPAALQRHADRRVRAAGRRARADRQRGAGDRGAARLLAGRRGAAGSLLGIPMSGTSMNPMSSESTPMVGAAAPAH